MNRKEKPLRELPIINWRVFKRLERRDLDEEVVRMQHVFPLTEEKGWREADYFDGCAGMVTPDLLQYKDLQRDATY